MIKANCKLTEHFIGDDGERLRRVNSRDYRDEKKQSERITWYIDSRNKPEGKKTFWIETKKGTSLILERNYWSKRLAEQENADNG